MIWKNKILGSMLQRDCSPIGIDIGHESVKMLQLHRRGERWEVSASGLHLFTDSVRQSPPLRWRQATDAIGSMMRSRPFRGNRVVASLDHQQALIKNARLPAMPPADLAEAVRWEAADRFPFDIHAGLVRHLVAGEVRQGGEVRNEILLFAASEQTLRDHLRLLEQAGCQPIGLDAKPLALARSMEFFWPSDHGDETPRVLADLGAHSCQLLIARGGELIFVKTIEAGSADLTREVSERLGLTYEAALALRLRLAEQVAGEASASDHDEKVVRAVTSAVRPVVERLAQEIVLCMRYYSVSFRGARPDRIRFVGGASHDRMAMHLLGESLGMEVQVGGPLADCFPDETTCAWGGGLVAGGPEWAVALGCCLKPPRRPRGPERVAFSRAGEAKPAGAERPPASRPARPTPQTLTVTS